MQGETGRKGGCSAPKRPPFLHHLHPLLDHFWVISPERLTLGSPSSSQHISTAVALDQHIFCYCISGFALYRGKKRPRPSGIDCALVSLDTRHHSKTPDPRALGNVVGLGRCKCSGRCHCSNRVGVTGQIEHFASETGSVVSSSPSASSHAPLLCRKNVFFIRVRIIVMVITSRKPARFYDWLSVRGTDLPNNLAPFALIGSLCRRDTQA